MDFEHWSPVVSEDGMWTTCAFVIDDKKLRWWVAVDWTDRRGRREPGKVTVAGHEAPATPEAIRRLPLATIFVAMQRHAEEFLLRVSTGPAPSTGGWIGEPPRKDRPKWRAGYRDAAFTFSAQRGRKLSASLLDAVAGAYKEAYKSRLPVTAAVAQATQCSVSTAGKRIMAARKAGLLDGIGMAK